jgi:hypothetical protein
MSKTVIRKKVATITEIATMGGKATLKKYGKKYFSKLAKEKRWGKKVAPKRSKK